MTMNPEVRAMVCIRCKSTYEVADYFEGCPKCLIEGYPSSLTFKYDTEVTGIGTRIPYELDGVLGEGNTPIVKHHQLKERFNLKGFDVKNEFQNPIGSHKDRMSAFTVARAKAIGAKGIIVASSGNAGLSLCAYAAHESMKCRVVTTMQMSTVYKKAIEAMGGELIYAESVEGRWNIVREMVESEGWYPATNYINPPVGSNPFGVQGYKNIAYEIYRHYKKEIPTHVLIPVSRGDLLWGIYEGFLEIKEKTEGFQIPKLVAIEPVDRLTNVMSGGDYRKSYEGDYSKTPSIGGHTVTYQSVLALKESAGLAVTVNQAMVELGVQTMGRSGVYLETSSALGCMAIEALKDANLIDETSYVLLIGTSGGFTND